MNPLVERNPTPGGDGVIDETYRGENLVFLVGCPRSGTTWLQRLLASHPRIRTGQESHLFDFYVGPQLRSWQFVLDPAATGRGGVGIGCYLTEEQFLHVVRGYMRSLLAPMLQAVRPGEIFLEKSPAHALYIPEIRRLLPAARFIHMVRDPRDVVASLLAASRSWGAEWAPRTARRAAATWIEHVQAVRASAPLLGPSGLLELRYEGLHERPVQVLSRTAEFLGLEWSESGMNGAIESNHADAARRGDATAIPLGGVFSTPDGTVREPEGFIRRARPGSWREDLSWREAAVTSALATPLMQQLGYDDRPAPLVRAAAALLGRGRLLSALRRAGAAPA